MTIKHSLSLLALVACFALATSGHASQEHSHNASSAIMQTQMSQRDLWVEHVFWVRNYVVANQQGLQSAKNIAATEVVANAKQIANSIAPLYGQDADNTLLELLAGHWTAVKLYSDASVHDDKNKKKASLKDLTQNAGDIADFLSGANPYLPRETLFSLLSAHGAHHVSQIQQIHDGQYQQEAKTWHAMRQHMLVIADALTNALAKQFPETF